MENFVLYDELGKANEQIIYKARRKGTIKYLAICCTDRHRRPLVSNHVRFVHVLSHPNVLQFHEWYETSNHLWLVMELCTGGSLEQVIKEDGFLPVNVVRKFGSDIVRGLQYIHSRGVIFNDTNPARFLLDGHGNVKLFDFSLAHLEKESHEEVLARFSDEDEFHQHTNGYECSRISSYTAPERLKGCAITTASDYWGLGCLLYHMSCGSVPFAGDTVEQLTDNILNHEAPQLTIPGKKPSCSLLALISSLLTKSSSKRITQSLLIRHEFWQNGLKDLEMTSTGETEETSLSVQDRNYENKSSTKYTNGTDESLDLEPQLDNPDANEIVLNVNGSKEDRLKSLNLGDVSTTPYSDTANFTLHTSATGIVPTSPRNVNDLKFQSECEQSQCTSQEEEENWTPDRRMVQSEYNALQSGDLGSNVDSSSGGGGSSLHIPLTTTDLVYDVTTSVAQTIGDRKFAPQPVPVETRATLALTFPWGDESPTLPHEPKLMLSLWNYLRGSFEGTAKMSIVNRSPSTGTPVGLITGWRPRPLIDYARWTRAPPTNRIDALSTIWNEAELRGATVEQIERHMAEVLVVFRSHGNDSVETSSSRTVTKISGSRVSTIQRPTRTHLLAYLIWLSATATAAISRTPLNNLRDEHRQLIGVTAYPELFGECVRQLKSSSSIPIELRIGLCQLCSVLMHRIATVAFCYVSNKTGNQSQQVVWKPIASNMPTCLASLVDILREPVARTGHRLRQIALAALGETLTCAVCLLTISVQEAEITGIREGLLIEVQSSQWQTVVHHLLRCLTPALTGSTQVPPSPGVDTPSPLDNLDLTGSEIRTSEGATSQSHGNGTSTDSSTSANTTTTTVRVTDAHVRLSAARALDAFLTAILGCRLHDLSVSGSLLASATACLQAVTTTDMVRHLWTNGVIEVGSARQTTGLLQRNQLNQEISLACASSLAAIIRINPSLFTTGLIDRIGLNSFVNVIEPPAGGPVCQQTSLVVRILSMACSGLLIPLSSRSSGSSVTSRVKRSTVANISMSSHSRQLVTNAGGAGTPAACRRILTDQRFMVAVLRHLKSPHAMLRAKSYLLCSAILATCPRDSFPLAFDANLPAVLERDLKTTRGVQHRYLDAQSTANMVTSTTDVTGSPCMMYLAACSLHFTDLLVLHLIPLICQQLLIALGCLSPPSGGSTRQTNPRAAGNNLASRRPSRPHSMIGSTRAASLSQASSTSALNSVSLGCNLTTARAWLPSITCLTGLLNACPTVRSRLLQSDSQALSGSREHLDSSESDFCLLAVLGRLLDLWASVDPISSSSIAGLHQPGTTENQLLCVTLTIIEDLSQHSELVESRRRDFICLILPGLARLAVAPGARPETRAICVKIVTNLADILLGESGYGASSTHSLNELHRSESVRVKKTYLDNTGRDTQANPYNDRRLSADVELLLKELEQPTDDWSQERTQSYSELLAPPKLSPVDVMTQSQYSPSGADKLGSRTRFYGATGSARTKRMERRSGAKTIRAAVQPPTPDVLVSLFEMVNKLMIPYVDQLIQCSEVTAPTAFIRLLNLLLGSAANLQPHRSPTNPNHTSNQTPTARGDCPDADTSVLDDLTATRWTAVNHRARALVLNMAAHGLDVAIVRLLASQLLNPSELDPNWSGKSQGSVASALCLALFHMVPLLLHWPRESRPSHWIIELRLLELIAIACLELGDLMFPPITDVTDPNETHRTSSQTRNQSPKKLPRKHPSPKSISYPSRSRLPSSPLGRRLPPDGVHAPVQHLYIPLLAGLEAMNTLLNHVADVVRIALAARSANASDSETAAMAAEEILVASRPPPSLAGLLARLVGLWRPKCVDGSSTDTPERMNSYSADRVIEEEICFQLCEAAITGLTNFASLYGGEYSRSALTPSAAASLSLGLLRLAEEEQKLQHDRCPTSSGPASFVKVGNPSGKTSCAESPGLKQSAQSRRRLRLLLRIIKRLVFSDPFCRSQLAAEATEDGGTSNLYTTLLFLGEQTQRNADASTTKLVREIIDFVKPAQRFARDRSAASADARATGAHVRKQSDTRIGPTKVA